MPGGNASGETETMVWVVAKRTKTKRGQRLYKKQFFATWQEARVYQMELWEKGYAMEMWEEKDV